MLTTIRAAATLSPSLAHRRACSGGILRTERGVASCGGGLEPLSREARDPASRALRPGREELANRSGCKSGEASAGPEPKTATVERREAGVPRYGTQGASQGAWPAASRAGPRVPRKHPTTLGAPPPFDWG